MSPAILLALLVSAPDPCTDSSYLLLRNRPIASMSEVEREYYFAKDRFCMEMARSERQAAKRVDSTIGARQPKGRTEDWQGAGDQGPRTTARAVSNTAPEKPSVSLGGVGGFLAGAAAFLLVIRILAN